MTVETFLMLLAAFSVVTSLLTEAVKKFLDAADKKYASNIIVLIVSCLVGGLGISIYYILNGIAYTTAQNIICIFLMVIANWLVSMCGYDKVLQAIMQLKNKE